MAKGEETRTSCVAALLSVAVMAVGCANERGPYPDLPSLGIRFEFMSKNLCGDGVSPEVRLGGVPAGTAYYRVKVTNISVITAPRWEATIKSDRPLIPEGAIANFDAPCPGEQQSFTYRMEAMALAEDGKPLAYGWQFSSARSLTRQIQQEQAELKRRPADRPDRTAFPGPARPRFFIQ